MQSIKDWFDQIPNDSIWSWEIWKSSAQSHGITVLDDDSGLNEHDAYTKQEAYEGFQKCTVKVISNYADEKIKSWAAQYDELIKNPPDSGTILCACDGQRIKLEISKEIGKSPFISTRAYVPEIVGCELGWFVTGESEIRNFGWRVILGTRSKDEVIRKFGISSSFVLVRSLKVLRRAFDGASLVAEVKDWE